MTGALSLAQALAESAAATLLRRVADSRRAAEAMAGSNVPLPSTFDPLQPGACELRESTLLLTAGSAALAAKLRQSLPLLLDALHRQGFELTEIKVRLQPAQMSYRVESTANLPRSEASADAGRAPRPRKEAEEVLRLADKLALTFPGTGVGDSARRLADSLRRRLARNG